METERSSKQDPPKRKGARNAASIPEDIREQLNRGVIETANLVEWLAVDQRQLLEHLLREAGREGYLAPVLAIVDALAKRTVNTINEAIGTELLVQAIRHDDRAWLETLANHRADLVRCWATYTIGKNPDLSMGETLSQIQPFAADPHFGVREICWMAVRKKITDKLDESISILTGWTSSGDERVRRFTTEATRPRGVWSEHIDALKRTPELALPLLNPLKSDPARYVQDSVGNWLNDASKTRKEFVEATCMRWAAESDTKETRYIIRKATRTLAKKSNDS